MVMDSGPRRKDDVKTFYGAIKFIAVIDLIYLNKYLNKINTRIMPILRWRLFNLSIRNKNGFKDGCLELGKRG